MQKHENDIGLYTTDTFASYPDMFLPFKKFPNFLCINIISNCAKLTQQSSLFNTCSHTQKEEIISIHFSYKNHYK